MKEFSRILAGSMTKCVEAIRPGMMRLMMSGTFGDGVFDETTVMLIPTDIPAKAIEVLHDFWCSEKEKELGLPIGFSCSSAAWMAGFADDHRDSEITEKYDFLVKRAISVAEKAAGADSVKKSVSLADEMDALMKLVATMKACPGESVGHTMANGKGHLFIHLDTGIGHGLAYVIEPHTIDAEGKHTPMECRYTSPYGKDGLLFCICLRIMEEHFSSGRTTHDAENPDEVVLSTFPDKDRFFSKEFSVPKTWLADALPSLGFDESIHDFLDRYTWDESMAVFQKADEENAITFLSQSI